MAGYKGYTPAPEIIYQGNLYGQGQNPEYGQVPGTPGMNYPHWAPGGYTDTAHYQEMRDTTKRLADAALAGKAPGTTQMAGQQHPGMNLEKMQYEQRLAQQEQDRLQSDQLRALQSGLSAGSANIGLAGAYSGVAGAQLGQGSAQIGAGAANMSLHNSQANLLQQAISQQLQLLGENKRQARSIDQTGYGAFGRIVGY